MSSPLGSRPSVFVEKSRARSRSLIATMALEVLSFSMGALRIAVCRPPGGGRCDSATLRRSALERRQLGVNRDTGNTEKQGSESTFQERSQVYLISCFFRLSARAMGGAIEGGWR